MRNDNLASVDNEPMKIRQRVQIFYNRLIVNTAFTIAKMQYALGKKDNALKTINYTAAFATSNYIGTYANAAIENFLLRVSQQELAPALTQPHTPGPIKKVLHVVTEVYNVGGHTRYLINWIDKDARSQSTIVFLHQRYEIPEGLEELRKKSDRVHFITYDFKKPILERAASLRLLAQEFDHVILCTHPHDIIPTLAFATLQAPPIALINHTDHAFGLGTSITDLLVQYKFVTAEKDAARRGIPEFITVPVPINIKSNGTREEARQQLALAKDALMLLTISRAYKFEPSREHNYFEEIHQVLSGYPNAVVYIIGLEKDSDLAIQYKHDRILFCGEIADTTVYEMASDIYVDSFPSCSPTAAMQAMSKKVPVLLMYAPTSMHISFPLLPFFNHPETKADWQIEMKRLIEDVAYRTEIATLQYEYVKANHDINGGWKNKINDVYQRLSRKPHQVRPFKKTIWSYTKEDYVIYQTSANNFKLAGLVITNSVPLKMLVKGLSVLLSFIKAIFIQPATGVK